MGELQHSNVRKCHSRMDFLNSHLVDKSYVFIHRGNLSIINLFQSRGADRSSIDSDSRMQTFRTSTLKQTIQSSLLPQYFVFPIQKCFNLVSKWKGFVAAAWSYFPQTTTLTTYKTLKLHHGWKQISRQILRAPSLNLFYAKTTTNYWNLPVLIGKRDVSRQFWETENKNGSGHNKFLQCGGFAAISFIMSSYLPTNN